MGIKGFNRIPNLPYKVVKLSDYKNQCFAVDANIQVLSSIFSQKQNQLMYNGYVTSHINTIFNTIHMFANNNIKSIWVFDSKYKHTKKKYNDTESITKLKKTMNLNSMFEDIKFLLKHLGVSFIDLSFYNMDIEAEQYCAYLTRHRYADIVYTTDTDALAFGATNVLTWSTTYNSTRNIKSKTKKYISYNMDQILSDLNITYKDLVKLSTLLGTDFCIGTKGIGPKSVISKLDTTLTKEQKEAYDIFTTPDILMNHIDIPSYNKNIGAVKWFLIDKNGFNKDRVEKMLKKI